MWDLETLRYLNEQAVIRQRMINGEPLGENEFKVEPVFPLSSLAWKLVVGPPSLSRLINLMENYESVVDFLELIREYLPEYETSIMLQIDDTDKMRTFHHHFGNKYFPLSQFYLDAYDDFSLADFTRYIPVDLFGFSYEDYHEFLNFRQGFIVLLALIDSPYDDESRIPVIEEAVGLVGKNMVELIPIGGVDLDTIHRMLDGTKYEGVAAVADWIHSNTGFWQLDNNMEDFQYDLASYWDRNTVDTLTLQWPKIMELQDKMNKTYEWLEDDLHNNFRYVLYTVLDLDEKPFVVPKEQLPLPI